MYIKKLLYENVGPIENINIDLPFNDNGTPQPILFVGENGCGKSTVLSNIVDSFYEIAGEAFKNARESDGGIAHQYYKAISPIEIHTGKEYMYAYVGYSDSNSFGYVLKSGNLSNEELKKKIESDCSQNFSFNESVNIKKINVNKKDVERMWDSNVLCYFGPDRYEKPMWMGNKYYETEAISHVIVHPKFNGHLNNPISVKNVTPTNLQWLLDVIIDSRPDLYIDGSELKLFNVSATDIASLLKARENLELIMSKIIGKNIFFSLNFRNGGQSRFRILSRDDNSVIVPSIDSLSTGQLALFNTFCTIVRYADQNMITKSINLSDITGIVVIDEIELHLHTKLQREILPELLKLFPKIQFIITTHAPLFLLGMKEAFGEDNFCVYELPKGLKIDVERFSEFQNAYDYFKQTITYQEDAETALASATSDTKTLVVTEGATDWKHLKAAFNSLKQDKKYEEIFKDLSFDFFEYEPINSENDASTRIEMGNATLCALCDNLAKLPQDKKYIFIADRDDEKTNNKLQCDGSSFKNWGNNVYSFILPIPESRNDTPSICIEHLYSDDEIKTEVKIDGVKRRLYIGNEFDSRGIASSISRVCEKKKKCGSNSIEIIDGTQGERVTSIENPDDTNYALPKMKFANYVLEQQSPFDKFDFKNFVEIFKVIKEIINDGKESNNG